MTVTGPAMMQLAIKVGAPIAVGESGGRVRRCIPLLEGTVAGDYSGTVVPGGADWQQVLPNGTLEISARYVLQLSEGTVEVRSDGLRTAAPDILARLAAGEILPSDQYYFRTTMRFFTGAPALDRLNHMIAIAVGERLPDEVRLAVYPVL